MVICRWRDDASQGQGLRSRPGPTTSESRASHYDCKERTGTCCVQHSNLVLLVARVTRHEREAACGDTQQRIIHGRQLLALGQRREKLGQLKFGPVFNWVYRPESSSTTAMIWQPVVPATRSPWIVSMKSQYPSEVQ